MKKVVGPMDSTEEYKVVVEEPNNKKKVKKTQSSGNNNKKKPKKKKPKRKVNRVRDWSFIAIVVSLLIILIPTAYMGVTLYRAYSDTSRPIIGSRFDNDLSPKVEEEQVTEIQTKLEALDGVGNVTVELTTATFRIYLELPAESAKETFSGKASEAQSILYEVLNEEEYFTADESKLQYDYEIYAHDALGDETIVYLLNKSSRMESANSQFLSDPVSQDMVDEVWARQEELDNPVEEEPVEEEAEEPAGEE